MNAVKTTLDIPDPFYRKLKVAAVQQGKTVGHLVNEAIAEKLRKRSVPPSQPAWKRAFGGLEHLHQETKRIEKIMQKEFSRIDPEHCIDSQGATSKLVGANANCRAL
jgi:hypothetical protein